MRNSNVPAWVAEAIQRKINAGDIGFVRRGFYWIEVERGEWLLDEPEEIWQARMPQWEWDEWDTATEPWNEKPGPTWEDFEIFEVK